jgi:riboflavin synthase
MFTGIVAAVGCIAASAPSAGGMRLRIEAGALALADVTVGASIAVNGACLTVVALGDAGFEVDVSCETLSCTTGFAVGARVNLERALRLSDRLDGHLVSGHVDGVGKVSRFDAAGDNRLLAILAPAELARYLARKGSIAVDGVSLTINASSGSEFLVNLIPHTLRATSLCDLRAGDGVNLEVDLLARYAERLLNTSV